MTKADSVIAALGNLVEGDSVQWTGSEAWRKAGTLGTVVRTAANGFWVRWQGGGTGIFYNHTLNIERVID